MKPRSIGCVLALAMVTLSSAASFAQAVSGTCTTCSADTVRDPNCGECVANAAGMFGGDTCLMTLAPADRRLGAFMTSDNHDARTLHFAHLVGGLGYPGDPTSGMNRAVSYTYNTNGWLYYGDPSTTPAYCAPPGGPPNVFPSGTGYTFPMSVRAIENAIDALDCYNVEVDRWYLHAAGHADGDRVCDGERAMFDPAQGAIFDLGGEGNRVVVFPYTDHGPLPCESFEYSVWLSDNAHATQVAPASAPDPTKWNPALLIRAFLQGWIPDVPAPANEAAALHPNLGNPTQRDGIAQVFALPCGLTFRYASVVAGNNGNPTAACRFYSFDAELDAVAGLNEDDTAICPDADGDGYRDATCGGNDCNDRDPAVHPGALETCSAGRDLNCDGTVTMCPHGTQCFRDFCAPECLERACADGFVCVDADGGTSVCLPSACANVTCPPGEVCGPSGCQDPCFGSACPPGQVCRGGACLDPCRGLACPTHQHCAVDSTGAGRCVVDCSCLPCAAPLICNATSGRCEPPGCSALMCTAGQVADCTATPPACHAPCDGVTCPLGQQCDATTGACTRDMCFGVACQSGFHCAAGMCVVDPRPDAGPPDTGNDDGVAGDGSTRVDAAMDARAVDGSGMIGDARGDGDAGGLPTRSNGCGCVAAGHGDGRRAWTALASVAALVLSRRGRRRRSSGAR